MVQLLLNNPAVVGNDAQQSEWKSALVVVDNILSADKNNVDAAFNRAQLLWKLGRLVEAKLAYIHVLTLSPAHFGAINNLGVLLYSEGLKKDARICYAEAVLKHPENHVGHINFANSLVEDGELLLAREHYEKALSIVPGLSEAHKGLANVFEKQGDESAAELYRKLYFKQRAITVYPCRGGGQPVRVLLLASTRGNVPIRIPEFFDETIFHVTAIIPEFYNSGESLPQHQLIVNLIGNADICRESLDAACKLIVSTSAPVINHPDIVFETGRVSVANRLRHVQDVISPLMINVSRSVLTAQNAISSLSARGFTMPFLLRTPGFSNGLHFYRVENAYDLSAALEALPGDEITVIQFLGARSADGKIRKYRVMMVDGKIYPLHVAISRQWKIHYETADMSDCSEHRAEDAAFLNNMPDILGQKAMLALECIGDILGLDYGGVDFSLNDKGEVLLFEANANMVVHPPDSDKRWDYRREPVQRVISAIKNMFVRRRAAY
jgi:hypothetical protein